jgi:hypothetical protein
MAVYRVFIEKNIPAPRYGGTGDRACYLPWQPPLPHVFMDKALVPLATICGFVNFTFTSVLFLAQ